MKQALDQKLIFVYNANSGARNAILDGIHKVFNPSTYACSLCGITYGVVSENKLWKKFREKSGHQMEFLHKDEFAKAYASKFGHKFKFPIVLLEGDRGLEVLISAQELNDLDDAQHLIQLLTDRTK